MSSLSFICNMRCKFTATANPELSINVSLLRSKTIGSVGYKVTIRSRASMVFRAQCWSSSSIKYMTRLSPSRSCIICINFHSTTIIRCMISIAVHLEKIYIFMSWARICSASPARYREPHRRIRSLSADSVWAWDSASAQSLQISISLNRV